MKLQAILALCLLGAAFAAPIDNFIDPDCIEEDVAVEEPAQEIEAEFALGVPDLILDVGNTNNDECEDELATEPMAAPEQTTEAECVDDLSTAEITTEAPMAAPAEATEECEEPLTTEEITTEAPMNAPEAVSEAEECVEEFTEPMAAPVEETTADECETEGAEAGPEIDIRIEPAQQIQEFMVYSPGEEQEFEPVEECEE